MKTMNRDSIMLEIFRSGRILEGFMANYRFWTSGLCRAYRSEARVYKELRTL